MASRTEEGQLPALLSVEALSSKLYQSEIPLYGIYQYQVSPWSLPLSRVSAISQLLPYNRHSNSTSSITLRSMPQWYGSRQCCCGQPYGQCCSGQP